jgi:hypothetical protein
MRNVKSTGDDDGIASKGRDKREKIYLNRMERLLVTWYDSVCVIVLP